VAYLQRSSTAVDCTEIFLSSSQPSKSPQSSKQLVKVFIITMFKEVSSGYWQLGS